MTQQNVALLAAFGGGAKVGILAVVATLRVKKMFRKEKEEFEASVQAKIDEILAIYDNASDRLHQPRPGVVNIDDHRPDVS